MSEFMSRGMHDVFLERRRQQEEEGFDYAHDDKQNFNELTNGAIAYILSSQSPTYRELKHVGPPSIWSDRWDEIWWKPTTPRRDLVKATALLIAEIERLDRAENKDGDAELPG